MLHPPIKTTALSGLVEYEFAQNDDCEKWVKEWNDNPHNRVKTDCQICEDIEELQRDWTLPQTISRTYYVRGAVSWPTGMNPGYVLVSAQDITTKRLAIYGESPIWHIQNMGVTQGAWSFFQKMWDKYKCRLYFYSDQKEHRRYSIQVVRESLLTMKPAFIEAKYAKDEGDADNLMKEFVKHGRIRVDKDYKVEGDNLGRQLSNYIDGMPIDEDRLPAVRALRALVSGYERIPYRGVDKNTQRCPKPYF